MAYNNRGFALQGRATSTTPSPTATRPSASTQTRLGLQQPGPRLQGEGRPGPRHRRLRRGLRLDPKYVVAFLNRGLAYNAKGDLDHAIADYDEASGSTRSTSWPTSTGASPTRRATSITPSPTTTRRSGSTRISPLPTTTAASPTREGRPRTAPSPTTTRPSDSTRNTPGPTTTGAIAYLRQGRPGPPSPTTTRPSGSPRNTPWPTPTGASPTKQERPGPCHRRLRRGHPARPEIAVGSTTTAASSTKAKNDLDHAIADYDEAIRLDPKLAWAYNHRGFAYSQRATTIMPSPTTRGPPTRPERASL